MVARVDRIAREAAEAREAGNPEPAQSRAYRRLESAAYDPFDNMDDGGLFGDILLIAPNNRFSPKLAAGPLRARMIRGIPVRSQHQAERSPRWRYK